ncbi:hypothetical protein FRC06_011905 [Ceratobasidium sp. 370]|nr:hypothetical protein FRC06_011905 [Ceratobasidium sp. 370]
MKIYLITTLICAATATQFVIPEDENALNPDMGGFLNKLGLHGSPKLEALKEAAQAAAATLEKKAESAKAQLLNEAHKMLDRAKDNLRVEHELHGSEFPGEWEDENLSEDAMNFGDSMGVCSKRDCKRQYHMTETVRWFKNALGDMGVFVLENPKATMALFIGATILATGGGSLVPMALNAVGFGAQGPIAGSIAALVQGQLGTISAGSAFAQLQSAAMGGAAIVELQKITTVAFAGLGAIGAASLLGAGSDPLGRAPDFEPTEWRNWEKGSRVAYNAELADRTARLWGPLTAENCVAYGYREYRAPIWFVPDGADPFEVCLRAPAGIKEVGFQRPLGCADERIAELEASLGLDGACRLAASPRILANLRPEPPPQTSSLMKETGVTRLPSEITKRIISFVERRRDVSALTCVSKRWRAESIPALYSILVLRGWDESILCLRTVHSVPNLANCVNDLTVDVAQLPESLSAMFYSTLENALDKTRNLRRLALIMNCDKKTGPYLSRALGQYPAHGSFIPPGGPLEFASQRDAVLAFLSNTQFCLPGSLRKYEAPIASIIPGRSITGSDAAR